MRHANTSSQQQHDANSDSEDMSKRLARYTAAINDKLKPKLKSILDARDKTYERASHYAQLERNIKLIQDQQLAELKMHVQIGSDCYCAARVPEFQFIQVLVGLQCWVELSLDEALQVCADQQELLQKNAQKQSAEAAQVTAHIKFIYEGMAELVKIADMPDKPKRVLK
jgi:prefoldin subunit 5